MAHTMTNAYGASSEIRRKTVSGFDNRLVRGLGRIIDTVLAWQDRAKGRAELRRLNDRMLRDIGISRVDAYRESSKPFWKC